MKQQFYSRYTAFTIVVGGIVGTGVFISLGYQLNEFHSPFVLMLLWVVGGVVSLCGALTYCELSAAFPRSGGEYNFLQEVFHPGIGFVAGFISATVGFAAPSALVAMTFGAYISSAFPNINPTIAALSLLLFCTLVHVYSRLLSGAFQNSFTYIKIALVILFAITVLITIDEPQPLNWIPGTDDFKLVFTGGFAVSLIYVSYAYAGWNSTTYIAEELENPAKQITSALIFGTLVVLVLYLLLNFSFLMGAPISELEGKPEVAFVVADYAFGDLGGQLTSILLAVILISTLSSMILAGPRVLARMGGDYPVLNWLNIRTKGGLPISAICTQSILSIGFVLSGHIESIVLFSGLALGFSSMATVIAALWRRVNETTPTSYRIPWFPLPPLVFLAITGLASGYATYERPLEGLVALGLVVGGIVLYALTRSFNSRQNLNVN